MNLEKLYTILGYTTMLLRKGPPVTEEQRDGVRVVTVDAMPHVDQVQDVEKIDCELVVVGVDRKKAEERRADLIEVLGGYPHPDRLAKGPSYIEVGGEIGDQGAAFQLFALGQVLGLWKVITPASLGITGDQARQLAGGGMVMMTGYKPANASEPLGSREPTEG